VFPAISTVVAVPEAGPFLIDRFEHEALTANHQVIRDALTQTCEAIMRQAAENFAAEQGGMVTVNPTPYRVDGEAGRFSFPTYAVCQGRDRVWNTIPTILRSWGRGSTTRQPE